MVTKPPPKKESHQNSTSVAAIGSSSDEADESILRTELMKEFVGFPVEETVRRLARVLAAVHVDGSHWNNYRYKANKAIEASLVKENMTTHCLFLADVVFALQKLPEENQQNCELHLGIEIVLEAKAQMLKSSHYNPEVQADIVRALTLSLTGNSKQLGQPARMGATTYGDAVVGALNQNMCVNTHDECDTALGVCKDPTFEEGCCICGGGKMELHRNMSYNSHIQTKTIVVVGGSHYSGTSLMEVILDKSNETSVFHGTGVAEDEGQHLQDVYLPASKLGNFEFGCNHKAFYNESSSLATEDNARRLWNQWSRYWTPEHNVYVEKSPPDIAKFPLLQALFHRAKRTVFFGILRHPLAPLMDLYTSAKKKKESRAALKSYVGRHLDCWINIHEHLREHTPTLNYGKIFRLEDFMQNFHVYLREFEMLIGLKYQLPVESTATDPHLAEEVALQVAHDQAVRKENKAKWDQAHTHAQDKSNYSNNSPQRRRQLSEQSPSTTMDNTDDKSTSEFQDAGYDSAIVPPVHRRLFFHGDKSHLIVNASMVRAVLSRTLAHSVPATSVGWLCCPSSRGVHVYLFTYLSVFVFVRACAVAKMASEVASNIQNPFPVRRHWGFCESQQMVRRTA